MNFETRLFHNIGGIKKEWEQLYNRGLGIWRYTPLQSYECAVLQLKSYYWNPRRLLYIPTFVLIQCKWGGVILPLAICHNKKIIRDVFCFSPIDYTDIITDINDASCLRAIVNAFLQRYAGYCVHIDHFKENSALYAIFGEIQSLKKEVCVNIVIETTNYETYFEALSKHQRQNIRTAYNRLDKEIISWHISKYDRNNPISHLDFKKCQLMYEDRCLHKNRLYGWLNGFKRYFRRQANFVNKSIRELEKSTIFVLYIGEEPAAYVGGYFNESKEIFFVPRLSINNQFRKYSAGIILVNEVIKMFILHHVKILDLTRGTEPYKYAMGGIEHYTFCVDTKVQNCLF